MLIKKINLVFLLFLITNTLGHSAAFGGVVEDSAITTEVKAKLLEEKDISSGNIEVSTKDRIVTLKGKVDTHLQAHKAVEIASSVDNVIDVVDSNLTVKESGAFMSDALITAKVKGKIRHLYIYKKIGGDYNLHVETSNGVVHIFGNVAKSGDVDIIVASAKEVKGVKSVKTNIKS